MKKIFILAAIALMGFASCADSKQSMTVTVTNPLALERTGEMVEVPMSDVTAKLQLADTAQIVVLGEDGQQCLHYHVHLQFVHYLKKQSNHYF